MTPDREKKIVFAELLDKGVVTVHLDPRHSGVDVPTQFRQDEMLRLNFSRNYHVGDFHFDDRQIAASLSFGGLSYRCVVPWRAVFALTDPRQDGQVWQDDLPPEVRAAIEPRASPSAAPQPAKRKPAAKKRLAAAESAEPLPERAPEVQARRPGLQVLQGGQADGAQPGPPRPIGHLRRIK